MLNNDKTPTDVAAIAEFKAEGKWSNETRHRQVKYLNNVVEADHGKLKLLIRPVRGFKTLKTTYATIKGFEVMRALRKGQAGMFALRGGAVGEARIVERAFEIGAPRPRSWRCYKTVWPTPKPKADTCPDPTTSLIHQVCNRAHQAAGHRPWRSALRRPRHPAGRTGRSDGEVCNAQREWTSIGYMNYVRKK